MKAKPMPWLRGIPEVIRRWLNPMLELIERAPGVSLRGYNQHDVDRSRNQCFCPTRPLTSIHRQTIWRKLPL